MMLSPQSCASLNSFSSTHAKQISFQVRMLFAFRAASTAAVYCLSLTRALARRPQLGIALKITFAASYSVATKHRCPITSRLAWCGVWINAASDPISFRFAHAKMSSLSISTSFNVLRAICRNLTSDSQQEGSASSAAAITAR